MKFTCSTFSLRKGIHRLNTDIYQYWLVLSGEGVLKFREGSFRLKPHELAVIPDGREISVCAETEMSVGKITLTDFAAANTKVHHYDSRRTVLLRRTFFYRLETEGEEHPYKDRIMASLDQIFANILFSLPKQVLVDSPELRTIIDKIMGNYTDPDFSVGNILKKTDYSEVHLRKKFLKEIGVTPVNFLINQRIEHAKNLLKNSDNVVTVREIAHESGFSDPYYFARIFKKKVGMTPTEYRENK